MRSIVVLGSTGSIGTQTLDVVRASPGAFRVVGLAAGRSWELLAQQVREFSPRFVAVADADSAERLRGECASSTTVLAGDHALEELCQVADYDVAVHGVVGARGLIASQRVLERGKVLALANKESLVVAGRELVELARRHNAEILPVDSELCAIHQCLRGEDPRAVRRVILTASGGPFRDLSPAELVDVTPQAALRHPNWSMGPRITIGSATLMNKALEVIETHHLFGLTRAQITVAIHRQSVVHSMVEFVDGSVIAQLGPPDMRGPLHYCLHHPARATAPLEGFDVKLFSRLSFEEVDPARFPALELGFASIEKGGDCGAVLNAADEVTVEAFLQRRIGFTDITRVNKSCLERRGRAAQGFAAMTAADDDARRLARSFVADIETSRPQQAASRP